MAGATQQLWQITQSDLLLRMLISAAFGGLIGIEREWSNHAAGFRTHILVCLGSTTIMLLSIYGFSQFVNEPNVRMDPARLTAQVISGIGFLGAGVIMRNGSEVKGLTTAASIWVVAAIGLCVGAGFLFAAGLCTLFVLISLYLLNKMEKIYLKSRSKHELEVELLDRSGGLVMLSQALKQRELDIVSLQVLSSQTGDGGIEKITIRFVVRSRKNNAYMDAVRYISARPDVLALRTGMSLH
ncbi:MgtC/SapB family protein [Paenibacillus sp. GCM10012307]|uniref:MgtC/SapB family protein n=1 Tax=Paenibacillus roseus TaxID=2798579 RepID=A0A934IWK6_9BACL|nr:MgtC/SapB family protein [Paenibacillus roseus]MBJ6360631.1 MgtC/SapB family protein [Paenibacillus roseus]